MQKPARGRLSSFCLLRSDKRAQRNNSGRVGPIDRITLTWDYGERTADFPLPQASSPQEGATRYDTAVNGQTLAVTIRRAPCQDTMSDESYPSTVEVVIDGRTLNGCGKSV